MDAGTLHKAIAEVCPVVSTSVADPNDRQTWTFIPDGSAGQPEIDAGNNVIQTISINAIPLVSSSEFIRRFTDAEYLALKQKYDAEVTAGDATSTKKWDIVIAAQQLDLNGTDAQVLKSDMVSDGILTQARADQIFS